MSNEKIISEATPIRIGLVIAFLTVFGGGIWWASSVNSKLDSIISTISESKTVSIETEKDITDLKLRVSILESKSPDGTKK